MGKLAYRINGIFARAVSWEVGKAIRRNERAVSRRSVIISTAPTPVSKEEKKWITSIDVLAHRVERLKSGRSKAAAREAYLLLDGAGTVHSQNLEFFSATLHSWEFLDAYKKFADLTKQMADFSKAHLNRVEIAALVAETQGRVRMNTDTWRLKIE